MITDLLFWVLIGIVTGAAIFYSCHKTVRRIDPGHKRLWIAVILGGAAVRLLTVGVLLYLAIEQDVLSGLALFAGLFIIRWILVIIAGLRPTGRFSPPPTVRS